MNEKSDIQKELNEMGSGLGRMKKEDVFKVPDGYFKALPENIMKRMARPKGIIHGSTIARMMIRTTLALASLMIIAYFVVMPLKKRANMANEYSNIETWLAENMDESTLIEIYSEGISSDNPDESLDSYLLENIDENLLIEEL